MATIEKSDLGSVESNILKDYATKNNISRKPYYSLINENLDVYIPIKKDVEKKIAWQQFSNSLADIDIGIVCNFGYMIPSYVIDKFPLIVVHPSLLPKYRGAAPI